MSKNTLPAISESICPYLNEIAERLWSGHAAIMIGAGFSRNATPNGMSSLDFPDWNKLGDIFYEKTHCNKPDDKNKYLNPLKLADELQAAFGRPVLDQVLRDAIPDTDYKPSPLHVKLLDLPWEDVFTTNYDTLLERACVSVTSQKYDIVIKKEDLINSKKPRIVKLHGSFPSERPFIITEEDYRRYPKDFAPFVNTVQQSLLENTLCLIGFSGDDLNFLQWIGWIRDHLGSQNSPKIYLVGVLNLTEAQKKLLEQRNVVLIDMADCSDVNGDHYKGLELFLDYLRSKKGDDNRLEWPEESEFIQPDFQRDKTTQLPIVIEHWKNQRLNYPGWLVLPEDRRSYLWRCTQHWIDYITLQDNLPSPLDLEFAFELNWRLEKCLVPIFNSSSAFFEAILTKYLSFNAATNQIEPIDATNEQFTERQLQNKDVIAMSLHLLIAMMRFYREEGLLEKWQESNNKINSLINYLTAEQKYTVHYERVLYALFALDLIAIKNAFKEWPVNQSQPFWEAKRAGLLAEIGQVDEAEKILEESLNNIRSKLNLKPIRTDYSLVSQEAFVMVLLRYVKNAIAFKKLEFSEQPQFNERWNTLKQYKCDPWNELKLFEYCLEKPPIKHSNVTEKQEFDIGYVSQTNHFAHIDKEALIAYNFLRFCEDVAIPFQIPNCSFGKKSAEGTLPRIAQYSPYWAMATMVRIGDKKVIDHIFNRDALSKMTPDFVDSLIDGYLQALEKSAIDISTKTIVHDNNFNRLLTQVIPEVLSRLCTKCSLEYKHKLIGFLFGVYKSDYKGNYDGIRHLTERLLGSFSVHERYDLIPSLLDFPILDSHGPIFETEFVNPFQFLKFDKELITNWNKPVIPEAKIDILFDKAASELPNARKWAISTLVTLFSLGLLKQEQQKKFADILWIKVDNFGFPVSSNYYKFAYINLPHPANIAPVKLIKQFTLSQPFLVQKNIAEQGIEFTRGEISLCREIIGASQYIEWFDEEINGFFNRLVEWWDADKEYLRKTLTSPLGSIAEEFKARFTNLINILTDIITRYFNQNTDSNQINALKRIISELQEYGLPTLRLEFACLHLLPESKNEIFNKIENGLASDIESDVIDSLQSIWILTERTEFLIGKSDLTYILSLLGQLVHWRKRAGLSTTLKLLSGILKKHPTLFNNELEKSVLIGLQHILNETAMSDIEGFSSNLTLFDRLTIRQEAASLAYELFIYYSTQNKEIPNIITEWHKVCCSNNEFAEIKNQWIKKERNQDFSICNDFLPTYASKTDLTGL